MCPTICKYRGIFTIYDTSVSSSKSLPLFIPLLSSSTSISLPPHACPNESNCLGRHIYPKPPSIVNCHHCHHLMSHLHMRVGGYCSHHGQVIPVTQNVAFYWLPCLMLCVMGVRPKMGCPAAGTMEADDSQVTIVFTVQPSFHHQH